MNAAKEKAPRCYLDSFQQRIFRSHGAECRKNEIRAFSERLLCAIFRTAIGKFPMPPAFARLPSYAAAKSWWTENRFTTDQGFMRTSAEFKVAHIRNWNLVVRWACRSIGFLAILLTAGCLSHDVSSRHAAIVGKEFITARDYYVIDGQVLTNVLLNTHQPAWIVEDMAYAERHYGFSPGTGIRKGNYDYSYALLPAGTKLSVEAVKRNNLVDAGVETVVVGSMAHPVTKQRVRWAFYLSTHGETIKRAPWEPDSVPASRPASEPWNAIHVLPQR